MIVALKPCAPLYYDSTSFSPLPKIYVTTIVYKLKRTIADPRRNVPYQTNF